MMHLAHIPPVHLSLAEGQRSAVLKVDSDAIRLPQGGPFVPSCLPPAGRRDDLDAQTVLSRRTIYKNGTIKWW